MRSSVVFRTMHRLKLFILVSVCLTGWRVHAFKWWSRIGVMIYNNAQHILYRHSEVYLWELWGYLLSTANIEKITSQVHQNLFLLRYYYSFSLSTAVGKTRFRTPPLGISRVDRIDTQKTTPPPSSISKTWFYLHIIVKAVCMKLYMVMIQCLDSSRMF